MSAISKSTPNTSTTSNSTARSPGPILPPARPNLILLLVRPEEIGSLTASQAMAEAKSFRLRMQLDELQAKETKKKATVDPHTSTLFSGGGTNRRHSNSELEVQQKSETPGLGV